MMYILLSTYFTLHSEQRASSQIRPQGKKKVLANGLKLFLVTFMSKKQILFLAVFGDIVVPPPPSMLLPLHCISLYVECICQIQSHCLWLLEMTQSSWKPGRFLHAGTPEWLRAFSALPLCLSGCRCCNTAVIQKPKPDTANGRTDEKVEGGVIHRTQEQGLRDGLWPLLMDADHIGQHMEVVIKKGQVQWAGLGLIRTQVPKGLSQRNSLSSNAQCFGSFFKPSRAYSQDNTSII